MTSASSSTNNSSALTSVPNVSQQIISLFLQTANTGDQANTRDDAGLPIVYGSCKLLDMLGYGSLIASDNTGKAAITKKYLGVDTLGDADNPLVYASSQIVSALPFLAYQKIFMTFSATVNGKSIKPMLIMWTIGPVLVISHWLRIWFSCVMPTIRKTISWVCYLLHSMVLYLFYRLFLLLLILVPCSIMSLPLLLQLFCNLPEILPRLSVCLKLYHRLKISVLIRTYLLFQLLS